MKSFLRSARFALVLRALLKFLNIKPPFNKGKFDKILNKLVLATVYSYNPYLFEITEDDVIYCIGVDKRRGSEMIIVVVMATMEQIKNHGQFIKPDLVFIVDKNDSNGNLTLSIMSEKSVPKMDIAGLDPVIFSVKTKLEGILYEAILKKNKKK